MNEKSRVKGRCPLWGVGAKPHNHLALSKASVACALYAFGINAVGVDLRKTMFCFWSSLFVGVAHTTQETEFLDFQIRLRGLSPCEEFEGE